MCQYAADDGCASDWHQHHVPSLALSGAGLVMMEATAVHAHGRITPGCLGLYSQANVDALRNVVRSVRRFGTSKLGIQLAHAGRKASCALPWQGGAQLDDAMGGWRTVSSSALPFHAQDGPPHALSIAEIDAVVMCFADATARAALLDFDVVELHAAHGYLLHQFLSPLINMRTDAYGGSLANRMRLTLRVFEAVRAVWPRHKPLGVRVSATDWVEGGWDLDSTVALARELKVRGCDFIDCSSGGAVSLAQLVASLGNHRPWELNRETQVSFSRAVRTRSDIATIAVGGITEPQHAEAIVRDGDATLVALGRALLWDPRWGWHAAHALGVTLPLPDRYARAAAIKGTNTAR